MWTPTGQVVLLQDEALPEWPCTFSALWSEQDAGDSRAFQWRGWTVRNRTWSVGKLVIRSLFLESKLSKNVNIRIHTDSTGGKSMATRFGTSKKTKHVQLRFLFIQELVASGVVSIKKVSGTSNPSDVMTKYITKEVLHRHLMALGITYPFGRVGWLRTACVQALGFTVSHFIRMHSTPSNCFKHFRVA